ncbi:hypothetical protein KIL84_000939 [Mauremys mutica]|uniref:Uncharacterized protein n=1 Tax=Mauremys mutica TaxID=74926 RepID=A0A9D3WXL2_9SAUR|nr:hypothetical protein KIL84_000939 [Mauremys mutica]
MFCRNHRSRVTVARGSALEMEIRRGRFRLSLLGDTPQVGTPGQPRTPAAANTPGRPGSPASPCASPVSGSSSPGLRSHLRPRLAPAQPRPQVLPLPAWAVLRPGSLSDPLWALGAPQTDVVPAPTAP